jgi:disulfide bond formation protein DsbB
MSIEPPAPPGAGPATSGAVANPAYTWAALAIAGLTALGAYYLSLAEGKFPCPLCFYQRAFVLGAFGVLLVGLLSGINTRVSVATLALPVASAGLGVALWHVNLERTQVLECPAGMFGISSAPAQSMAAFGLLCAVLLLDAYQPGRQGNGFLPVVGAVGLGLILAAACCVKLLNPQPERPVPATEYDETPPKICLPVRQEKA